MKYPLETHRTGGFYPPSGCCGFCGSPTNGNFVAISMNAMQLMAGSNTSVPAEVETSLSLIDHGVTKAGVKLEVFRNTNDAFFCSIKCLKAFFNMVVDDFENGSTNT